MKIKMPSGEYVIRNRPLGFRKQMADTRFRCGICLESFNTATALIVHGQKVHNQ